MQNLFLYRSYEDRPLKVPPKKTIESNSNIRTPHISLPQWEYEGNTVSSTSNRQKACRQIVKVLLVKVLYILSIIQNGNNGLTYYYPYQKYCSWAYRNLRVQVKKQMHAILKFSISFRFFWREMDIRVHVKSNQLAYVISPLTSRSWLRSFHSSN